MAAAMGMPSWETHYSITSLMHQYHRHFGRGEWDQLAALFEHAKYRTVYPWSPEGHGTQQGAAQVVENFRTMVRMYDGLPRVQYRLSNVEIEANEAAGRARARSQYVGLAGDEATWSGEQGVEPGSGGTITLFCAGRYEDEFERVDGAWRFASRTIHADLTGDRSMHMGVDPVAFGREFAASHGS